MRAAAHSILRVTKFTRAAATRDCKECRCRQTARRLRDKLAPTAWRTPWRSRTDSSVATAYSRFAELRMHFRKFPKSTRDKIWGAAVARARFQASAGSLSPLLRRSILEFQNSGRRGFVRQDDTAPLDRHRQQCAARAVGEVAVMEK